MICFVGLFSFCFKLFGCFDVYIENTSNGYMQKSTKNNNYRFNVGDTAYLVTDDNEIIEIKVVKRLKRPHRLSDNFYFCEWTFKGKRRRGIRYEKEMYDSYEYASSIANRLLF